MSTPKYTVKLSPSPNSGRDWFDFLVLILTLPEAQSALSAVREGRGFTITASNNAMYSFCADYFCWVEITPYTPEGLN